MEWTSAVWPSSVCRKIRADAVQDAGFAAIEGGGVAARYVEAFAGGFDAVELDLRVVEKRGEQADGIGAAADAGDERYRQAAFALEHLRPRLRPMTLWKSRTMAG